MKGPYRDVQGRLYSISTQGGAPQRLGGDFDGNWQDYTILSDGTLLATGAKGTSTQVYRVRGAARRKARRYRRHLRRPGRSRAGRCSAADALRDPRAAGGVRRILSITSRSGEALTHFNAHYLDYAQSEWRPYTWKSA